MNINLDNEKFNIDDIIKGMNVELEHGTKNKETNITAKKPFLSLIKSYNIFPLAL